MAVKPEVIKARLKVLFPKANLSQKRIDAIAAKLSQKPADDADNAAIDEVINTANDYHSFEEIAKDDDRIRTLEAAKPTPAPTEPAKPAEPTSSNDDAPAWAKTLLEKVDKLEKRTETDTKQSLAAKALTASKELPEALKTKWLNRIDINSEISFEDQVKALEEEYTELRQITADSSDLGGTPPAGGSNTGPTDAEIDNVVNNIIK